MILTEVRRAETLWLGQCCRRVHDPVDLEGAFETAVPCKIMGHLHAEPRRGRRPECLRKPPRHLDRN